MFPSSKMRIYVLTLAGGLVVAMTLVSLYHQHHRLWIDPMPSQSFLPSVEEKHFRHLEETPPSSTHTIHASTPCLESRALNGVTNTSSTTSLLDLQIDAFLYHPPDRIPLPRPVRLLRIPKAGSSSFSAFLRLQYDCITPNHPPGECTLQNKWFCPKVKGCNNHDAPPTNWSAMPMMTVYRDPIKRYLSAYTYPSHHGLGSGGNIKYHTYLFPEWNNTMTNYMSGARIGTWGSDCENCKRRAPPRPWLLPGEAELQQRLDRAIQLTRVLAFVGLLEYWSDTLLLFCRKFACPPEKIHQALTQEALREMSGAKKLLQERHERLAALSNSSLPYPYNHEKTMQALRDAHRLDYQLYDEAAKCFCQDLFKYRADFAFWAQLTPAVKEFCLKALTVGPNSISAVMPPYNSSIITGRLSSKS